MKLNYKSSWNGVVAMVFFWALSSLSHASNESTVQDPALLSEALSRATSRCSERGHCERGVRFAYFELANDPDPQSAIRSALKKCHDEVFMHCADGVGRFYMALLKPTDLEKFYLCEGSSSTWCEAGMSIGFLGLASYGMVLNRAAENWIYDQCLSIESGSLAAHCIRGASFLVKGPEDQSEAFFRARDYCENFIGGIYYCHQGVGVARMKLATLQGSLSQAIDEAEQRCRLLHTDKNWGLSTQVYGLCTTGVSLFYGNLNKVDQRVFNRCGPNDKTVCDFGVAAGMLSLLKSNFIRNEETEKQVLSYCKLFGSYSKDLCFYGAQEAIDSIRKN